jgi:CRISPR system Cascade subunit CasB
MSLRSTFYSLQAPDKKARLREWHQKLIAKDARGDRAQLRRAATPLEAALVPAFYRMLDDLRLPERDLTPDALTALAALAMIAARVDTHVSRRLGLSLGKQPGQKEPVVSEARFRRLLESADLEERLAILRRLVAIVDKTADLHEIVGALFAWDAERRRKLAYDYYTGFAPSSDIQEEFPS